MFINRSDELEHLTERWDSNRGEFFVLYGRRRVGKSHLLAHFADQDDRQGILFEASSGTSGDNLIDISREIARFTGRADHAVQEFTTWRAVFAAFDDICKSQKAYIILDEFQFIAREEPETGSLINRLVQDNQDNENLFLVISGSDVSFFSDEVMGYGATSYGRRTGSLNLQPFRFEHAREFVPAFSIEDQIRTYAVFGGMPYYLAGANQATSLKDAIFQEILVPGAKLREEPTFLLAQESKIRDADVYRSVLRAIAEGKTSSNEVSQRIGRARQVTGHYLDSLEEIGLIFKRFPVTQTLAGNRYFWEIKDPFLRFWFRFVAPHESRLVERKRAKKHLSETVMPELDEFVSIPGFEEVCRQWAEEKFDEIASIGNWWSSRKERQGGGERRNVSYEVDVMGIDSTSTPVVLGSCKWSSSKHPVDELRKLKVVRDEILEVPDARLLFFSRSDVSDELRAEAEKDPLIQVVTISELAGSGS